MATVEELLRTGVERLRASGSESPRLDAELLLGPAVGLDRTRIVAYPEAPVGESARPPPYEADLARREQGEPIAYIRGLKEFHGLAFASRPPGADPATRDRAASSSWPRPRSSRRLLAGSAAAGHAARSGSPTSAPGSGAIAIALAVAAPPPADARRGRRSWPPTSRRRRSSSPARTRSAHGVADRIEFIVADLLPLDGELLDVVGGEPAVHPDRRDRGACPSRPRSSRAMALDGGPDGLDVIRPLVDRLPRVAPGDGVALLEIGADQADAVRAPVADADAGLDLRGAARPGRPAAGRRIEHGSGPGSPAPSPRADRVADPRFPIRLLALDLDGTLVEPDLVAAAADPGGDPRRRPARRPRRARDGPDADECPAVRRRSSGCTTRSSPTRAPSSARCRRPRRRLGRLVYHRPLPADVARETIRWTREHGFAPHLNHLERFIIPAGDPRTDDYSAFLGARAEIVPGPRALDPPSGLEGPRGR